MANCKIARAKMTITGRQHESKPVFVLAFLLSAGVALGAGRLQEPRRPRPMYCDENGDHGRRHAEGPKKLKTPDTLVFTYTPVEDPAVYEKIFKPFTDHLAPVHGKTVVFYQVQSNAAEIEAMRSGACTWAASPPARRRSRSTSPARCPSRSRATRRTTRATT
jgi:ABC-type phosphate/phosphonate transport system substrate-binding protein